jgi:hypothetical protein
MNALIPVYLVALKLDYKADCIRILKIGKTTRCGHFCVVVANAFEFIRFLLDWRGGCIGDPFLFTFFYCFYQ